MEPASAVLPVMIWLIANVSNGPVMRQLTAFTMDHHALHAQETALLSLSE